MENIKKEWEQVNKIKIFEIPVITPSGEETYIIFDIDIHKGTFRAEHEGLNDAEIKSNKIAFVSIDIDADFSLDQNLEELYTACIEKLLTNNYQLRD